MFSESREDNPEVGSSTKRIAGSLNSSSPMFNLLRCPPLIAFFKGEPTFSSLMSLRPKLMRGMID